MNQNSLFFNYNRFPVHFVSGKNALLIDSQGNKYIDFLAGISVNNLGHRHPKIIKTIKQAIKKPLHVSNLFEIKNQNQLAKKICELANFDGRAFFCNSGSEANEAAYKFVIKYAKLKYHSKKNIVLSATHSFHGRTIGSINLTGTAAYKKDFKPHLPNIYHFTYNNSANFLKKINKNTAAVFLELIQGEAGVYLSNPDFVLEVKKSCEKHNALLIIDDVQAGNFRTGQYASFNTYGIRPDGFTTAKGLGAGLPIGAFFADKKYSDIFQPGDHGSTFGGNPFIAQVALTCLQELKTLAERGLLQNNIDFFSKILKDLKNSTDSIKEIRQGGLMIGIELNEPFSAKKLVQSSLDKGLILNATDDRTLRLLPPLNIKKKYILKGMDILTQQIKHLK